MRIHPFVAAATVCSLAVVPLASSAASAAPPPVASYGAIWTVDSTANSVAKYDDGAHGSATPAVTIAGPDTGLSSPSGIAVTPSGDIYVSNAGNDSITEYSPTATGDATPIATIAGPKTGLDGPRSITYGYGEVWVVNPAANLLTSYAVNSTGNELPAESIGGDKTKLDNPVAVTLFPAFNQITVLNTPTTGRATFLIYARGKRGNIKPDGRFKANPDPPVSHPDAFTTTGGDDFWAVDASENSVTPIDLEVGLYELEYSYPIAGKKTGIDDPVAVGVDAVGRAVVANAGNHTIEVFGANAQGNAKPLRTITGVGDVTALQVIAARPSAPTKVKVAQRGTTAAISWQPPTNDGGGVVGYEVDLDHRGQSSFFPYLVNIVPIELVLSTTHTSITRHLTPGVRYDVTVAAVNRYGERAARVVHVVDAIPPSQPRSVRVTAAKRAMTVHWARPFRDGGALLRRYTIQYAAGCDPGTAGCHAKSVQVQGFQTSERIGSLKAGTRYDVRIIAHNRAGASQPSATAAVTTAG